MEIRIKDRQRKITISKKYIAALARQTLRIKGIKKAELSILFAGKRRIRALNKQFREIDRPTDVLAFSMREGKANRLHPEILGDVVICPEMTHRDEIGLCLVHGILHLLGYDDSKAESRSLMEKEQLRILKKINKR